MKRALLLSAVIHLVVLTGAILLGMGTGRPSPKTLAVHLGKTGVTPTGLVLPTKVVVNPPMPPQDSASRPVLAPGLPPTPVPQKVEGSGAAPAAPSPGTAGLPGDNLAVDTLTPGAAEEKPTLVSYPAPAYPREARRNSWEGVVEVEITVDVTGHGSEVKVLRSSGHQALDEAALEALRQAKYEPASHQGVAEAGILDAVVRFRLN